MMMILFVDFKIDSLFEEFSADHNISVNEIYKCCRDAGMLIIILVVILFIFLLLSLLF